MNNVLVYELAVEEIAESPQIHPSLFCLEDNIGESIHLHYRNTRLDFTVEDFKEFAETLESARIE